MTQTLRYFISAVRKSYLLVWAIALFVLPCVTFAQNPTKPTISVSFDPSYGEAKIGQKVKLGTIHITTAHMRSNVDIELRGKFRNQFELQEQEMLPAESSKDIDVYYHPTALGEHNALVYVTTADIPEYEFSKRLVGISTDPNNPPRISINPTQLTPFTAVVGQPQSQTINITTSGLPQSVKAEVLSKKAFRLSSASIYRNIPGRLIVTFAPNKQGTYKDTVLLSAYGIDSIRIPIVGTATATPITPTKEGDEFVLSTENPIKILNEKFETGKANQPLEIQGWKNVALKGLRAWWHYTTKDDMPENVAKVTPFDSKVEYGEETPCEMLLVTPALDFKNAVNHILTFRVRGDYLRDNQTDTLRLYLVEMVDGKAELFPIEFPGIPNLKDQSGEWMELQADFANQQLPDVGFFAFGFKSMRGTTNAATYYLDDVTFGRPDLPVLNPSVMNYTFHAEVGKPAVSDVIHISTQNLTSPIQLQIKGSHASKFKLTHTSLPTEGGDFAITFQADKPAIYKGRVKITSRGAADKYVELVATVSTGISQIQTNTDATNKAYNLQGKRVLRPSRGCYIINGKKIIF